MLAVNSFLIMGVEKVSNLFVYSYHMGTVLKPYSAWKKMAFGDIVFVDTAIFGRFHFAKQHYPVMAGKAMKIS